MEQEIITLSPPPFPIDAFNLSLFSSALSNTDSLVERLKAEQAKNAELCEKLKSLNESAVHMKNLYESEKSKKLEIQSNDILYELKYTELLENFNKFSNETCNAELLHQQTISELENNLKSTRDECLRQCEVVVKLGGTLKSYGGLTTATKRSIILAKEVLLNEGKVFREVKPRGKKATVVKKEVTCSVETQTEAMEEIVEAVDEADVWEPPIDNNEIELVPIVTHVEPEPVTTPVKMLTPVKCTVGTITDQNLLNSPFSKSRSTTTRSTCTSVFIKKVDFCCNFPEFESISVEEIFKETILDLSALLDDPIVEMREPTPTTCDIACQTNNIDVTVNRRSIGIGTDPPPPMKKPDITATDFLLEKIKKEAISPFGSMYNLSSFQYKDDDHPNGNCSQLSQIWQLLGETIFTIMRNEQSYRQSATDVTVINRNIEKIKELIEVEKQLAKGVEKTGFEWHTSSDENEENESLNRSMEEEEAEHDFQAPLETTIQLEDSPVNEKHHTNLTKILLSPISEVPQTFQIEKSPESHSAPPKRRSSRLASTDSDTPSDLAPNVEPMLVTPPKARKRIRTTSSTEEPPTVLASNEQSAIEERSSHLVGVIRRSPRLSGGLTVQPAVEGKCSKKRSRKTSLCDVDKLKPPEPTENIEMTVEIQVPEQAPTVQLLSPIKATPKRDITECEPLETDDESPMKLCQAYKLPSLIEPLSDLEDDTFESPESPMSDTFDIDIAPVEIPLDRVYDSNESPLSPSPSDSEGEEEHVHQPVKIPLEHISLAGGTDDGPSGLDKLFDSNSAVAEILRSYNVQKRRAVVNRDRPESEDDAKAIYKHRVVIEQYLDGDWTSDVLHSCCAKLVRNGVKLKQLVTSLLEIVEDNSGEEVNVAMTPPAPAIPLTQQKLLLLIQTLSAYHQKSFEKVVLFELDRKLFTLKSDAANSADKKLERVLTLTNFYIGMMDMTSSDVSLARIFVYKALYYHGFLAIPMIYQVLQVFPHVLPRKSNTEYDNSDPVISTLQTLLMSPANYAETHCAIDSAYKKRNLLSLLQKYYGYALGHPTQEELVQNLLGKLAAGKLENLDYCLILVAKRNGHDWAQQKLVHPHLYPALNELLSVADPTPQVEAKLVLLITTIASILKTRPKNQDSTQFLQLFTNILETSHRPAVQEAAIESLLKLQRFGCVEVFKRLQAWTPCGPLSQRCRTMLATFIYRRDFGFWRKLMHQI